MKTAIITLSEQGLKIAQQIRHKLPDCELYIHENVQASAAHVFASIVQLTDRIFHQYGGIVYIVPCGVVVRAIAAHVHHKTTDPAVVVVDVGGRWAISLLSGHEGGANKLSIEIANIISAEPIVTTTTEALKDIIVGVGCRKGMQASAIKNAIKQSLDQLQITLDQVRYISTIDVKSHEAGILETAEHFGIPVRIISSDEIRSCTLEFEKSEFVSDNINVPAVAEPCALLAGRRTRLILPKTKFNGVTIAIAKENCMSLV